MMEKPPLGVMPEDIHEVTRIIDLARAINEYCNYNVYDKSIITWCRELELSLIHI